VKILVLVNYRLEQGQTAIEDGKFLLEVPKEVVSCSTNSSPFSSPLNDGLSESRMVGAPGGI
jgi:hypothetical protein